MKKVEFDPAWNEVRATCVRTYAIWELQEALSEGQVKRHLRQYGYVPEEIIWGLGQAREWIAAQERPRLTPKQLQKGLA